LKLKPEHKVALAISVPIIAIGTYLIVSKVSALTKKYLMISVGEGGTTDPPPGTHTYNVGETVTIKAIPNEGYTVGTWIVDGIEVAEQVDEYTITMDINHTVVVTFWKEGQPPASYPTHLQSLGSIHVVSNVGAWLTGTPGVNQCCHVAHCDENWNKNALVHVPIRFKALDAAERPVPNVDVLIWTDPMPDGGRYRGTVLLNDEYHPPEFPLVVKTDNDGVATAYVSYVYGLGDGFKQLAKDAGVGFQYGALIIPCAEWAYARDGLCLWPGMYVCWVSGDCETGLAGCERMGDWQRNLIHAKAIGVPEIAEIAYCGFHMKWI